MKNLVVNIFAPNDLDIAERGLNDTISTLEPRGITLDLSARQGRRKMGTARQGYVQLVDPIAHNNLNSLSRDIDPQRLRELMVTFRRIGDIRGLAQKVMELCDDTMMAYGIDAVALADAIVDNLNTARKRNDGIDVEMAEIDRYNKRFAHQMEEEDEDGAEEDGATDGTTGTTTPTT